MNEKETCTNPLVGGLAVELKNAEHLVCVFFYDTFPNLNQSLTSFGPFYLGSWFWLLMSTPLHLRNLIYFVKERKKDPFPWSWPKKAQFLMRIYWKRQHCHLGSLWLCPLTLSESKNRQRRRGICGAETLVHSGLSQITLTHLLLKQAKPSVMPTGELHKLGCMGTDSV